MVKKMIKKRILIKGKVYGVGYRLHLLDKAEAMVIPNIGAWNGYENGKELVEVLVGADKEKVDRFITFLKENSPKEAGVEGTPIVENYEGDIPAIESFSRSFSTSQLAKIANAGVGMLKMQDKMLEKQDKTIEAINLGFAKTEQNFNSLDTKYDKVSNKLDKMDTTLERLTDAILLLVKSKSKNA